MFPRYTLIIPHYHQLLLLERLMDTIPVRADLQVVVVDDGSPAEFAAQWETLKEKYAMVEFLQLPNNRGGGAARNEGLKAAKGDYVFFADADDYFYTDALNALLDRYATQTSADMICFNAKAIEDETGSPSSRADRLNWMMIQSGKEREQLLRFQHSEPWCKLIRREVIIQNGLQFDETHILNDVRFSYLVGYYAERVLVDDSVCYCVCNRQDSVGKKMVAEKKKAYTRVMVQANQFFKQKGLPYCYKRAYRPLVFSLIQGQWQDVRVCMAELRSGGEGTLFILLNVCLYPWWLLQWAFRKRRYRQARIKS